MINKFNRVNILEFTKKNGLPYVYGDLLRQTAIERIVKENKYVSPARLHSYILGIVEVLLNEMIVR